MAARKKSAKRKPAATVLLLRFVGPNGESYNGQFRWPLKVGARVAAPDWLVAWFRFFYGIAWTTLERRRLERELAKKPEPLKAVEVPILKPEDRAELIKVRARVEDLHRAIVELIADVDAHVGVTKLVTRSAPDPLPESIQPRPAETLKQKAARVSANGAGARHTPKAGLYMPKVERLILTALAQHQGRAMTRARLALPVDYHRNAKAFANGLGRLRGLGLVDGLRLSGELAS